MQALEGLKVVEVGNIIAGPWCGSMLADFGATVIKVEPPKGGDLIRGVTYSPFMPLIAVALIYLVMVMFFTWLVGKLERRLRASDH